MLNSLTVYPNVAACPGANRVFTGPVMETPVALHALLLPCMQMLAADMLKYAEILPAFWMGKLMEPVNDPVCHVAGA